MQSIYQIERTISLFTVMKSIAELHNAVSEWDPQTSTTHVRELLSEVIKLQLEHEDRFPEDAEDESSATAWSTITLALDTLNEIDAR